MWFKPTATVTCFYCNTTLPLVPVDPKGKHRQVEGHFARGTKHDFDCSVCGCMNERDDNGQIVSTRAAFYDPALNGESFSKRGSSTSRNSLASSSSSSSRFSTLPPFCRQCLSNQSLQIHLISSYPSSTSSDDEAEEEEGEPDAFPPLPDYKAALDRRYPLVCTNCKGRVEEIVRERDYKVKTSILGGRLRETGGNKLVNENKRSRDTKLERRKWIVAGGIWRLRAVLWMSSHLLTVIIGLLGMLGYSTTPRIPYLLNPLSLLNLLFAPLWTFWDPTWKTLRNERKKRTRSKLRLEYRRAYILLQGIAFSTRLASSLVLQFSLFSSSLSRLLLYLLLLVSSLLALLAPLKIPRISTPPPILLRSTDSPLRASTPTSQTPSSSTNPLSSSSDLIDPEQDPLEPLQNLSIAKKSSILSRRSGTTTSTTTARNQDLRKKVLGNSGGGTKFGQTSFSTTTSARHDASARTTSFPENLYYTEPTYMQLETEDEGEGGGDGEQENTMDWTPTSSSSNSRNEGEGIRFRPRKFIVPDLRTPTGLEGILEKIGLGKTGNGEGEGDGEGGGEKMDLDEEEVGTRAADEGTWWWRRWIGG